LTHKQIEDQGLIERYVRHQLPAEEAAAVEDHYFNCDACFESVEATRDFMAAVQHAGRKGWLESPAKKAGWLFPAFGLAAAAAVVMMVGMGYLWLVRLPASEIKLSSAVAQTSKLEARLSELDQRAALDRAPDPNVPVVILTADRAAGGQSQLTVNEKSPNVLLWIDAPQTSGGAFQVAISGGKVSKTIDGVVRNSNGALAVGLPSSELPEGYYTVRVSRDGALIGEYRLKIARR